MAKHIDYGLSCMDKKIFRNISSKSFDLKKIIINQIEDNDISIYETKNRFYEIGNIKSLNQFTKYAKKKL